MKQCFVIMPYGGDDPDKRRHYAGVYQSIIAPAARAAGYEPKRSDIAGEPGNITHDIIRDLSESDVVIADLTSANPNVFFELGIRHAFRKSGTVHIINASHAIPFDVRQYRAIEYSIELADIPDITSKITEAIQKRMTQPERPDNPVHDAIPQLPINISESGDEALREQLRTVQEAMETLHREKDTLTSRLEELSPADISSQDFDVDVDDLLDRADEIMKTTGEHAVLRLRQAIEEGGTDAFVKHLRVVLKSPYLDENDFREIILLCKQTGLEDHRRAALEVARHRYPYSSAMFLALVDALDDSPNPADQERGRIMIEDRLGIMHAENGPEFREGKSTVPLHDGLGILFNLYTRAEKHDWILSLVGSLPENLLSDVMIMRNRARALAKRNENEQAASVYEDALKADPTDDQTLAWYADFLDDQGRYADAYEMFEKAITADPEDGNLYINLGIHILNRGHYRGQSGEIEGPLPRKARSRVAVPFVMHALVIANNRADMVQKAVRVLARGDALHDAEAIAAGRTPEGKYDRAALSHLLMKIESSLDGKRESDQRDPDRDE